MGIDIRERVVILLIIQFFIIFSIGLLVYYIFIYPNFIPGIGFGKEYLLEDLLVIYTFSRETELDIFIWVNDTLILNIATPIGNTTVLIDGSYTVSLPEYMPARLEFRAINNPVRLKVNGRYGYPLIYIIPLTILLAISIALFIKIFRGLR